MTRKNFMRWFLFSMMCFGGAFYVFATPIIVFWYDMPMADLFSIWKYIALATANLLDVQLTFPVDLPSNILDCWHSLGWTGQNPVTANGYLKGFELLPGGWVYKVSSYWFYVSFIASIVFAAVQLGRLDIEKKVKQQTHIRGAEKATARQLTNALKKQGGTLGISIGEMELPRELETRHFLVLGTTGTGKSYLLLSMIDQLQQRNVNMVVLDRKGEFFSAFGQPEKDKLFNPYDSRHEDWNLFNEFSLPRELNHIPEQLRDLADSLFSIPVSNQNAHFYHAAADVFCSCLCYLALQGKTTNLDIKTFFASGGAKIVAALKTLPAGLTDGLAHLGKDGTDEHSGSILSTLTERCKDFSAFVGKDGNFSVRTWARSRGNGNLYLSTAGPNDERYKSVVTMLLDIIGREVKAMPETSSTCLAIVIDELASLPPLKTLSFLVNEGRSKGVCVILANQTYSKLREIYGEAGAKNLFGNCNTKFIFRLPEPSDAEYVSKAIGEQEVVRVLRSENETTRGLLDTNGDSQGVTTSEQIIKEAVFLPSQLERLPKRHAIALIPHAPVAEIELPTMHFPLRYQLFAPLEEDSISAREIAGLAAAERDAQLRSAAKGNNDFLKL